MKPLSGVSALTFDLCSFPYIQEAPTPSFLTGWGAEDHSLCETWSRERGVIMVCALLSSGLAELPLPTCLWDSLGLKSRLNVKHRKSCNYLELFPCFSSWTSSLSFVVSEAKTAAITSCMDVEQPSCWYWSVCRWEAPRNPPSFNCWCKSVNEKKAKIFQNVFTRVFF